MVCSCCSAFHEVNPNWKKEFLSVVSKKDPFKNVIWIFLIKNNLSFWWTGLISAGFELSLCSNVLKIFVIDLSFWNLMLGIVGTAPYLRGMMRSPKISRKRRCEIFYKNEELTKRRDSGKKGEYLIFLLC